MVAILLCSTECASQLASGEEMLSLEFDNVDIRLVIKLFSDLMGIDFIACDEVRGPVTVRSTERIPESEWLDTLESILDEHGFVMVPAGEYIEIVPIV